MTNSEFLIKLRDAAAMIVDAANQELEKLTPPELKNWDPQKIKWVEAEGSKGPYQRYPAQDEKAESTEDYRNLLADLRDHGDKLARGGFFYWLFQDGGTIGRKRR